MSIRSRRRAEQSGGEPAGWSRGRKRRRTSAVLERLEDRTLLAVSSVIQIGTGGSSVVMTGDGNTNDIGLELSGTLLEHLPFTAPSGQAYADNFDFDSTDTSPPTSQNVTDGTLPVTINASGTDTVYLGVPPTAASSFKTAFTVIGSGPNGSTFPNLTIDDSSDQTTGNTITVTPTTVSFSNGPTITYSGLGTLDVIASGQNIVVAGTPAGTTLDLLNFGPNADNVTIGSGGSAQNVQGPVIFLSEGSSGTGPGGPFSLTVDDSADPTGRNATLNAATENFGTGPVTVTTLTGLTPAPISYSTAELTTLSLVNGTGNNSLTVDFSGLAPITSSQTLTLNPLTSSSGTGVNTLNLMGGAFTNETYNAFGPGAGSIDLDGATITFAILAPINDISPATNFTFNAPAGSQAFNIVNGPLFQGTPTTQVASGDTPAAFELVNFANKTNVVLNTAASDFSNAVSKTVNLNNPTPGTGLATLAVNTGSAADTVNVTATPTGVATTIGTDTGNDTVNVTATGLGGPLTVNGAAINVTLNEDAGGGAVNASTRDRVVVNNGPVLSYANVAAVNITRAADNLPLTPVPQTITATQGQPLTNVVVGSFTDADPNAVASDYVASVINWGDGMTSAVTSIVPNGSGSFNVIGSHTYLTAGQFPVTVTVTDRGTTSTTTVGGVPVTITDVGGPTAPITSQAQVAPLSFVVTNTNDSGAGSLRQAILNANEIPGTDTITFQLPPGPQAIQLLSALPPLSDSVNIDGPGATSVTVSGGGPQSDFSVFTVNPGVTASISGLTIANGNTLSNNAGAGVDNLGTVALAHDTITGNAAPNGVGGGVENFGTATLTDVTISGNTSLNGGGGFFNFSGTATLTDVTIADNVVTHAGGGGLYVQQGTVTFTGGTISGNTAQFEGGGVIVDRSNNTPTAILATAVLSNVTIAGNTIITGGGGGVFSFGTTLLTNVTIAGNSSLDGSGGGGFYNKNNSPATLNNTIIAGNLGGAIAGVVSGQNDLIDDAANAGGLVNGVNGNLVGVNPMLAPPGNYGGPTQTMPPLPGSPAIDAGNSAFAAQLQLTTDQRGLPRFVGASVDIGAVESSGFTLTIQVGSSQSTIINTPFGLPLGVVVTPNHAGDPITGGVVTFAPPALGPSATLGAPAVAISGAGVALVTATANGVAGGPYAVVAATRGAAPVSFFLANIAALSPFVVINTNDSGVGSLRQAILNVNAAQGAAPAITFDIPATDPGFANGVYTIRPLTHLPPVTEPVMIDGASQPGFAGKPVIVIDGSALPATDLEPNGLIIDASNTTVTDLVIDRFVNGVGIEVGDPFGNAASVSGVVLTGNYVGTDPSGTAAAPNYQGVLIFAATNSRVGGTTPAERNVISGNVSAGVQVYNSAAVNDPAEPFAPTAFGTASGNMIVGNLIGTDVTGTARVGNAQGVFINDAPGTMVVGNVISGNRSLDVQILGPVATNNVVSLNDLSRLITPGSRFGVYVYAGPGNQVIQDPTAVSTRDLASGPEVESASPLPGNGAAATGVLLTFTTYLDRTRAQNTNNYLVNLVGANLLPGRSIPVVSATYDGINRTVTLALGAPIPNGALFQVRVVGTGLNGITDTVGNPLDGSSILPAPVGGSDAILYFQNGVRQNLIPTTQAAAAGAVPRTARKAKRAATPRPVAHPAVSVQRRVTHPAVVSRRTTHPTATVKPRATHPTAAAGHRTLSAAAVDALLGSGTSLRPQLRRGH